MPDAYDDALDRMEQAQARYWETFEDPDEPGDEDDLLTPRQRQWIYDHF
jgi:hypothetical protein